MKTKALLEKTDTKYLRRLVREINLELMTGNGVYGLSSGRCIRFSKVTLKNGVLKGYSYDKGWNEFTDPEDCYGRKICASQKP